MVLSTSPDVKQHAKRRRSACWGSSSAFKDAANPANAPFSVSMLDVDCKGWAKEHDTVRETLEGHQKDDKKDNRRTPKGKITKVQSTGDA
jgi:hypothetical protein